MEIIENVKSKDMWPTTTYTFTIKNINNERIKNEILKRKQEGLGFQFDPMQGGGWQSNKDLLEDNRPDESPKREQRYKVTPKPSTADADDDFGFSETTSFFQDALNYNPETGEDDNK